MNSQTIDPQITSTAASGGPVKFAATALGLTLYPWQEEVLRWFASPAQRVKGTVAAPNGSGKDDRVIAALALWWITAHPRGRVVITSRDGRQIDQQTQPAIRRHAGRLKGCTFLNRSVETAAGGRIVFFTTDEPGRAEGWHKEDDARGPLLIIVNEAKSVPDDIFRAFDRCTFNGLLYISSTGLRQGRFYESHTRLAAQFRRRVVRLDECPHIDPARIEDILSTYGPDHPFTKSTLFSEFMSEDDASQYLFPLELVESNFRTPPRHVANGPGDRSAFCDFAAGGDENVLAIRTGNRVEIAAAWRETDTMAAVGRFATEFHRAGLVPGQIFADEGGLGIGLCDRLREMGWDLNRVNFGAAPFDKRYKNRGAEMWHEAAAAVLRGEIILPADSKVVAQLTTRKVKIESDGRLGIASKETLRRENLPSPDRADAVCGAWSCRAYVNPNKGTFFDPDFGMDESFDDAPYDGPPGMDAGL
jgi:phage terminase large subunit